MKIQLLWVWGTRRKQCWAGVYGIKCICQRSLCGRGNSCKALRCWYLVWLHLVRLPLSHFNWPGLHQSIRLVLSVMCDASSEPKWFSRRNSQAFPHSSDHPTGAGRLQHPALHSGSHVFTCAVRYRPARSGHGMARSVLPASEVPTPTASTQANVPITGTTHRHSPLWGLDMAYN